MKSIKVKVKLFSIIRIQVGTSELELEIPDNATVQELLNYLESIYEKELDNVFRSKNGHYTFSVKVNGQNADISELLKDGDTVVLLTPVCGG